jgi:transposase
MTQSALPLYTHKKSPHRFTFPQLAACVLMTFYMDISYRDMEEWLMATDQVRRVLELKEVPNYSTLSRAAKRLKTSDLRRMRDELLKQVGVDEEAMVADSTGFTPSQASSYYVNRTGKPIQEFIKGLYVMGLHTKLIVGWASTRKRGIDSPHLASLRRQAAVYGHRSHGRTSWVLLADTGFDGPKTLPGDLIPAARKGTGPMSPVRRERAELVDAARLDGFFGQRWQVETLMSVIKRKFGDTIRSRLPALQLRETYFKGLVYNIHV